MNRRVSCVLSALCGISLIAGAQQKDNRVREYISPTRIVWQQGDSLISHSDMLTTGEGIGQATTANISYSRLRSTMNDHPALLLDFGKELQGGLQIVTGMPASHHPVTVRIRYGESASEAMCEIDGQNGATNDHALRDFTIQLPWLGVTETGNSGFRFARIDLLSDTTELLLKEIRAISVYLDIPEIGSFRCNDERLNTIWQTGKETVHLNMQQYLWDGIKRDRLIWIGDMYPEVKTILSVYGSHDIVPQSIDLTRDQTPLPAWMNGISSYSIWWLIIQHDWFYYTGDMNYLKQQQSYLHDLLNLLITKVDEKGMEQLDGRFLDWPSSESPAAIHAGLQSLMMMALQHGAELCHILGDDETADKCTATRQRMSDAQQTLCDAFAEADLQPSAPGTKQAAALLSLAGLLPAEAADARYLSVDGVRGFSTYFGYYMLLAMAKANNYRGALDAIRTYWGAMIDLGATSFWEDFNIDWTKNAARIDELVPEGRIDIHQSYGNYCYKGYRHSLCHGWASGPTAWMSRYVLGFEIVEPGCKTVRIHPHLADLQWAEGSCPTPYGAIKVRHEKLSDGSIRTTLLSCPKEIKIIN